MTYRGFRDGRCKVCKAHAELKCISCGDYFCSEHITSVDQPNNVKKFWFCAECLAHKKKPSLRQNHPDEMW